MWDSDPREGSAIVLARFPAEDVAAALSLALAWSRRYNDVVLGESPRPGAQPNILAQWHGGERLPVA
jgi:hypothetical protein